MALNRGNMDVCGFYDNDMVGSPQLGGGDCPRRLMCFDGVATKRHKMTQKLFVAFLCFSCC